jgi:hypothetical protein
MNVHDIPLVKNRLAWMVPTLVRARCAVASILARAALVDAPRANRNLSTIRSGFGCLLHQCPCRTHLPIGAHTTARMVMHTSSHLCLMASKVFFALGDCFSSRRVGAALRSTEAAA